MNPIIPILFFLLIDCLAANKCFCQQQKKQIPPAKLRAILYTLENGLTSDAAHTILKDAEGFLWVGSVWGQLFRFDGITFKHSMPEPKKVVLLTAKSHDGELVAKRKEGLGTDFEILLPV